MSDVFGVSGRAMLKAPIEGRASVEEMADLAKGQLRRKRSDLILALEGRMEEHHRFLLATQLRRLEAIEHDIAALDLRIVERLEPYRAQHALLMQIPGVDWLVARGAHRRDRRRHERVPERLSLERLGRRLSWQPRERRPAEERPRPEGQCPPPHDAGRRRDLRREDQGQPSQRQIPPSQGPPRRHARGALAIAHKILVSAYHMLAKGLAYRDLGEAYLDQISHKPAPSQT